MAKILAFCDELSTRQALVAAGEAVDAIALVDWAQGLEREAQAAAEQAQALIADLKKQSSERETALNSETAKLQGLENRLTLRSTLDEVRDYVERAQWASKAGTLSGRLPAVLRTLTEQSKVASKELLDQDFQRFFEAECSALRAPKVTLDFAGRKGQAARKKSIVPDHRLSEILSEGEQKVIALADFLSEAALHRTSAPIIFDDPVNSLDYRRLQHVVDRLVSLSASRQVIVFTHNIWFTTELLHRFEKTPADCTYYSVSEANGQVGVVTLGSHPRWDTVNKLAGRVNQLVQGAGAATGETQNALIESAYERLRSWCEVVVEQEILGGVTQRYQPNVAMTRLPQIKPERLGAARDIILPIFERACRYMPGHSQPLETLGVRPSLNDLREDWKNAQAAREAYTK